MGAALIHIERQTEGWTNSLITFLSKRVLLWQLTNIDYNQYVFGSSYSVRYFFLPILNKCGFLSSDIHKSVVPNFIEMRPVGTGLIHADRQTDMTKEIGSFRDYDKAPK